MNKNSIFRQTVQDRILALSIMRAVLSCWIGLYTAQVGLQHDRPTALHVYCCPAGKHAVKLCIRYHWITLSVRRRHHLYSYHGTQTGLIAK